MVRIYAIILNSDRQTVGRGTLNPVRCARSVGTILGTNTRTQTQPDANALENSKTGGSYGSIPAVTVGGSHSFGDVSHIAISCYIGAVNNYDVIILGGGAAGLMCASVAGSRGRHVVVLEGANKIGKKILISGGGRCNFTNLSCEPSCFISANPSFCISALSRYTPQDFIDLVEKHGIAYHEKTAGQLFCDHSSKDIVAMLETECLRAHVRILTDSTISSVDYPIAIR